MTDFYSENSRFYVSVDCIIFGLNRGRLSVLLARRGFEPEKGKWSLMGGFVRQDENLNDAAMRVLRQLTGLSDIFMEQVGAFGEINRDPGDRVISVAYYALINFDEHDRHRVMIHDARWVDLTELPELSFDHPAMIEKALAMLRRKFSTEPIGFNLLPRLFTLSQLQALYESVLGEPLDKRNFRKRVADMACIRITDQIDKTGSRRGAALYRYDEDVYRNDHKFRI